MPKAFNLKKVLAPVSDIVRKLKNRRDVLMAEVDLIDNQLARFGGKGGRGRKATVSEGGSDEPKRKVRRRRSREQLVAMASDIVKFIGSKGKEGATAKEVKSQFGNLLPSVNAWLKLYSTAKVKTTGSKSKMRYFA
jgi:hypothetical protein